MITTKGKEQLDLIYSIFNDLYTNQLTQYNISSNNDFVLSGINNLLLIKKISKQEFIYSNNDIIWNLNYDQLSNILGYIEALFDHKIGHQYLEHDGKFEIELSYNEL